MGENNDKNSGIIGKLKEYRIAIYLLGFTLLFAIIMTYAKPLIFGNKKSDLGDVEIVENSQDSLSEYGFVWRDYEVVNAKIKRGDYFSTIMTQLGVSQNDIYALTQKCKGVFDLGQMKVGYDYHAYFKDLEHKDLEYLVYDKDNLSYVVFSLIDTLGVRVGLNEFEMKESYAEVIINNSLWVDLVSADVTPLLAIQLADIYAWTIDFFGLQKGDTFKAIYYEKSFKGEVIDVDRVEAVVFTHLGQEYPVYYFEQENVGNRYWNEKGESTQKAFLKAPLSYKRISSGFTYARRHPITRVVRPHTGVDYAAPKGTPVMSIGDGVVVQKGYKGGGGHTVKIKHNSVYQSAYLHLSKYGKGIAVGTRVKQGQVIGYVGSTGMSTGPHLDFRVWKNGTPINPLKMKSPPSHPISKENKAIFQELVETSQKKLKNAQINQLLIQKIQILS